MQDVSSKNIFEEGNIPRLILKFSIPAILGGLINALYNIADQVFIGQKSVYLEMQQQM